jgi:hypothetical protein
MTLVDQLNQSPWRFKVGDEVFIAGHQQEHPAKIREAFGYGPSGWPHYRVVDHEGAVWVVPQQMISVSRIPA